MRDANCRSCTDSKQDAFAGRVSRREMLQRSSVGFGYLALAGLLADEQRAEAAATRDPLAPRAFVCGGAAGGGHGRDDSGGARGSS